MRAAHDEPDAEPEMRLVLQDTMSTACDEMERLKSRPQTKPRVDASAANAQESAEDDGSFVTFEKSNEEWNAVVGQEAAKDALLLATEWVPAGDKPFRSVLLYGPPGTGKTMLARALARRAGRPFASISSADVVSKWQGETERHITRLFERAAKIGGLVFIDEFESLCSTRQSTDDASTTRIKTAMLVASQLPGDWLLICATNNPWWIDPAQRRRFHERVHLRLPTADERRIMLGEGTTG